MPAYDVTADDDAFLIFDHRSAFWQDTGGTVPATLAGQPVRRVDNVSASGKSYSLVAATGTVTLGIDGGGHKFLVFDGASTLKVPTSTAFDAEFTNTGNAGGNGLFVAFDAPNGTQGFILSKQSNSLNQGTAQVALFTGTNGYVQRFSTAGAVSWRPYHGGYASGCISNESGTVGPDPTGTPNYRDGSTVYYNGTPAGKSNTNSGRLNLNDSAGFDLTIGAWYVVNFTGNVHAIALWNRCPKYHEVLATDRHYRTLYGGPEVLTNQPAALVWESNSESVAPNGNSEPGIADRVAVGIGSGLGASFNLAKPARKGSEIVADYAAWTAPLLAYLASLGVTTAVHFWELVNDAYSRPDTYPAYYDLVSGSGAKFSASTAMCSSTYTSSLVGAGNIIAAANAQVLADAAARGYQVGLVGTDPASAMASYDAANFSDGVHWNPAGIALGYPYFLAAVRASLAAPGTAVAQATAAYRRRRAG